MARFICFAGCIYCSPDYSPIARSASVCLFAFFAIVYARHWWTVQKLQNSTPQVDSRVSNFRVYAYTLLLAVLDLAILCVMLQYETFELNASLDNFLYFGMLVRVFVSIQLFFIDLSSLLLYRFGHRKIVRIATFMLLTPVLLIPFL